MTSSHPTPVPCQWFSWLAAALDRRSAPRLALLFLGAVLARGRRTVTTWIRAAGLSGRYQSCYIAVAAAGKRADRIARRLLPEVVRRLLNGATQLALALDDTPTKRYGPHVQGAGVHHNPTPGPAGSPYVFVVLGLLATHKSWGTVALPLLSRLYVRKKDLPGIDPKHRPEFRTRLELAVELLRWAKPWLGLLNLECKQSVGAGQHQVRFIWASIGAFHVCLWTFTMTEAWAWGREDEELVDRSASPWDSPTRRPSEPRGQASRLAPCAAGRGNSCDSTPRGDRTGDSGRGR